MSKGKSQTPPLHVRHLRGDRGHRVEHKNCQFTGVNFDPRVEWLNGCFGWKSREVTLQMFFLWKDEL